MTTARVSAVFNLLLLAFSAAAVVATVAASDCNTNRPGWGDHRTLYVPEWMMEEQSDSEHSNEVWTAALCCVYTYVEVTSSSSSSSSNSVVGFEVYDGSSYNIRGRSSFADVASKAMGDICDMQMGREDCNRQSECVDAAFAAAAEVEEDTAVPIKPPTLAPTMAPSLAARPPLESSGASSSATLMAELVNASAAKVAEAISNCTSDRPGWPDHRTLYMPEDFLALSTTAMPTTTNATAATTVAFATNLTNTAIAWIQSLCCVFTYVEPMAQDNNDNEQQQARMEVYDGYTYAISGGSLVEIATAAMDDICDMSMGRQDCQEQAECVDLAMTTPTNMIMMNATETSTNDDSSSPEKLRRRLIEQ